MLGWRFVISAILIPAILVLFWLDAHQGRNAPILLVLCMLLSVRAAFEMVQLLSTRAMKPSFFVTATCNVAMTVAAWTHVRIAPDLTGPHRLLLSLGVVCAALVGSFLLLLLLEAVRYRTPGNALESLGANLVTVVYTGGLLAVLAQLRWFPDPAVGYFAIGSVIVTTKCGDIMAYALGRAWGKRKMVPTLSPGKTWAGALGAIIGSCLGGWLWLTFGGRFFAAKPVASGLLCVLAYSATMGVAGLIGDLGESLIKRDAEKKDSARLMPGFGGLLDLMDSPLFVGPLALAWWIFWAPAST